jgi:hypothetical protein
MPTESVKGYFDFLALKPANTKRLQPFTTTGWAEMDVLYVKSEGVGLREFPHISDFLGYLGVGLSDSPLKRVERALAGDLQPRSNNSLRHLSFQVGQAVDPERDGRIHEWEKTQIAQIERHIREGAKTTIPTRRGWAKDELEDYYAAIRTEESKQLHKQVIDLAGVVALQNEKCQLYVERERGLDRGSGWLAPLVGLSVRPEQQDYYSQVHEVVPVVTQKDGAPALLFGANSTLYTERDCY